jgi:hypothetical protein
VSKFNGNSEKFDEMDQLETCRKDKGPT